LVGLEKKAMMRNSPWPAIKKGHGLLPPMASRFFQKMSETLQATGGLGNTKRPNKPKREIRIRNNLPERISGIITKNPL